MRILAAFALLLAGCGAREPTVVITVGNRDVHARLARQPAEHYRGLKGVTSLGPDEGMLFLYGEAGARRIWMKGCKIDLDVAFIDESGRILQIDTLQAPAHPDDEPQRARSKQPASMVLEMPAGWFKRNGIGLGAEVVVPSSIEIRRPDP